MNYGRKFFLICCTIVIVLANFSCNSCATKQTEQHPYKQVSYYFGEAERDSLTVDLVTYIGRKAANATVINRFEPQFRGYYTNLAKDFQLVYYHIDGNRHTYFMTRPARTLSGNRRGVLGTFVMDSNNIIRSHKELMNTVAGDEETVRRLGARLMKAYLLNDGFAQMLTDRNITEWPDGNLYYDTLVYEWRSVPYEIK